MAQKNSDFFKAKKRWSSIKDQLLGCYLPQYFQKLLMTGKPIFYVDCFAGKGRFDDGSNGSPRIALQIRDDCLSRTNSRNSHIDTCFIDLNYANELLNNTLDFDNGNGKPQIVSGRFEENIEGLLQNKRGNNVFLYIDPYGIKALDSRLFDKFALIGLSSIEMLINMNSFGFFRDACRVMQVDYSADHALTDLDDIMEYEPTAIDASPSSDELLCNIAGGDYWKCIVNDFRNGRIDGYQAEQQFSQAYKRRLRKSYKYVLDLPIRMNPNHRPKYRMIHVTNHADGCFLMAQNMQKRKDELFIDVQQGGQLSFFNVSPSLSIDTENCIVTRDTIEEYMKACLQLVQDEIRITGFITNFVNEYGVLCEFQMIYRILEQMEASGEIEIRREPNYTARGQRSSFWEEKNGKEKRKVYLRRIR